MTNRLFMASALLVSAAAGVGVGLLVLQADDPDVGRRDVQSIRGIKGIDTVMLQNLEAVLRMQSPPPPPQEGGGGGVRAAAALMTMENEEPLEPEEEIDGREELTEIELEGS